MLHLPPQEYTLLNRGITRHDDSRYSSNASLLQSLPWFSSAIPTLKNVTVPEDYRDERDAFAPIKYRYVFNLSSIGRFST